MGITIAGFDLTSQENLLIIANLVLIIIAIFLLIRLRMSNKKNKPGKENQTELAGIADIKPEDFKMHGRFDLNKGILQQEKSDIKPFDSGLESKTQPLEISITNDVKSNNTLMQIEELNHEIRSETGTIEDTDELPENPDTISIDGQSVTPEINELKLEDDAPEETIVFQSEEVASRVAESLLTSSEKVPEIISSNIVEPEANKFENPPAALEVEPDVTNPGNIEKPKKKAAKKKKPKKKASKRESLF